MQVQYSYWPVFNGNCTFIHVKGKYPKDVPVGFPERSRSVFFAFDPATSTAGPPIVLETPPPGSFLMERSDMIWSGISPDLIYGHNDVHKLWAYNVTSQQYTMIKDFSGLLLPNGGLDQMSKSLDDQVFAFTLTTDPLGEVPAGYFVWHRESDQILVRALVPNLDEVQVDKSGRYLIVVYNDNGHDEIFDLAPSPPTLIDTFTQVDGFGFNHRDTGKGTLFSSFSSDALGFRRLATPKIVTSTLTGSHRNK